MHRRGTRCQPSILISYMTRLEDRISYGEGATVCGTAALLRNDRNGLKEQAQAMGRDLHALGAYFCRTFFLLGDADLSALSRPVSDSWSFIACQRRQLMRSSTDERSERRAALAQAASWQNNRLTSSLPPSFLPHKRSVSRFGHSQTVTIYRSISEHVSVENLPFVWVIILFT